MAAYSAPLAIINGWITYSDDIIPFSGYLLLLLFLYGLVLSVIAVKAVYQFSWLKSLIANFFLPVTLIGSVLLILVISSPQFALETANEFMTALKNRDFSQFSFNEEPKEEWPQIDKGLPIIKVDELIALIKEIDDSIKFHVGTEGRKKDDGSYDLIPVFYYWDKDFGDVNLSINLSNSSGEDKFEEFEIIIDFPKGKFKLHEEKITHLFEKYISGLVTLLVKEPEKVEEILSKRDISFFENYAYNIYQEQDSFSGDSATEQRGLLIRIVRNG